MQLITQSQKGLFFDNRMLELEALVAKKNAAAIAYNFECDCNFQNPEAWRVGTQRDHHGNEEPLYVQTETCSNCGAMKIF